MNPKLLIVSACALALSGCVAPMSGLSNSGNSSAPYGMPSNVYSPASDTDGMGAADPDNDPIYAWDGGVVDSPDAGSVVEGDPNHDVQPTSNGRMYILELYQDAIDERDALQLEVTALNAALERAQFEMDDFASRTTKIQAMVDKLTMERDQLRQENSDLAARVVTAQIRRLEAEKLLLESKLEWFRQADFAVLQRVRELEQTASDSNSETPVMTTGGLQAAETESSDS
ncbi:MAG: hypothetical protein ACI8TQ_000590 [Planctomycetota bacterium]|jgi:hypothetical protein